MPDSANPRAAEQSNLAVHITAEEQKKIVGNCIDVYLRDRASRAARMKRLKDIQEMYALVPKAKNHPFQNAANIKTPAVTAPVLQISSRLFDMTWPATGKVFNVVAASMADQKFAHICERFANSYVRYNVPHFSLSLADTIHQKCLYGSAFRRTYWDSFARKVRTDRIGIEDFVVPYTERCEDPDMAEVPHYTYVMHLTHDEIMDLGDEGLFVNTSDVKADARGDGPSDFKDAAIKISGVDPDEDHKDVQRDVFEHHCRLKLPKNAAHPVMDGKRHYVYIVVDVASEVLLRLCVREEDDPDDRRRYDRESAKMDEFLRQREMVLSAQEAADAAMLAGAEDPMVASGLVPPPQIMVPPMPPPPFGTDSNGDPILPAPIRQKQICFFTHYRCFPSEGFYGLGYGDLIYGIALAINTLLNQFSDSGSIRNSKPAFMSRQIRMARGDVNVQPGSVTEIDGPMQNIREAIMFLDPPTTDPGTIPLIKILDAMKDTMVGNADLMSGQPPGSNQTKAGMQILSEQMMMPISVLARQTREELKHDLIKIWRCLGVFLEDDDVVDFLDVEQGAPAQERIGRWMFSPTAHLVPASDPRAKSQRIEDYQNLFGFVMSNPFIQNSPAAVPIMRAMTEEGFKLYPDGEKLVALLPPAVPPGPPPPPPPKPQWAENAGFLRGEDSPVNPADNHHEHVAMLMEFLHTPEAQSMDAAGRAMAEKHHRGHLAAMIEQRGAAQDGAGQLTRYFDGPSTGQGAGFSGMAPPPNLGPPFAPPA